jgi:hypothetical protein
MLSIIIALVVVGIVLYCINAFVPMDPKVKMILNVVVILLLVVWLLQAFGLIAYLDRIPVGRPNR